MTRPWYIPRWVAELIWPAFCTRCDTAVTRWHHRRCNRWFRRHGGLESETAPVTGAAYRPCSEPHLHHDNLRGATIDCPIPEHWDGNRLTPEMVADIFGVPRHLLIKDRPDIGKILEAHGWERVTEPPRND